MVIPSLAKRIYQAQCFGNVEPVEYMVPYPNLGSLPEGQTIKHGDHLLYKDISVTNKDFFNRVNKTANWLLKNGVQPDDRILVKNMKFPYAEILAFAIWTIGASIVITSGNDSDQVEKVVKPKLIIDNFDQSVINSLEKESIDFYPNKKPLLNSEALVYLNNNRAVQLSHYNLLVNTYGVQQLLNVTSDTSIQIDLQSNSTAWTVLQAILPLYSGATITTGNADIQISTDHHNKSADYIIENDLSNINNRRPKKIYVIPEATAVLGIGNDPNFLTSYNLKDNRLTINGPSVMMGYLDNAENNRVFTENSLILKI